MMEGTYFDENGNKFILKNNRWIVECCDEPSASDLLDTAIAERDEARQQRDAFIKERDRLVENLEIALNATVLNHRNDRWHMDAEYTLQLIKTK
jgi:hypothetical protein